MDDAELKIENVVPLPCRIHRKLLFVLSAHVACSIYSLHLRAQVDFNKGQVERQKEGGKLNDEMEDSFTFSFTEPSF